MRQFKVPICTIVCLDGQDSTMGFLPKKTTSFGILCIFIQKEIQGLEAESELIALGGENLGFRTSKNVGFPVLN